MPQSGRMQTGWSLPRHLPWTRDRKFKREEETWSELFRQDRTSAVQITRTGPIYWLIIDRCTYVGWLSRNEKTLKVQKCQRYFRYQTHSFIIHLEVLAFFISIFLICPWSIPPPLDWHKQTDVLWCHIPPVNVLIMVWPLLQACLIEARLDPSPGFLKFPSRHIFKWLIFYGFPTLKRF